VHSLVERFQRAFTAERVAEEDGEKVDHLVVTEAPPHKMHTLSDLGQDIVLAKVRCQQHDFSEPGRRRRDQLGRGLDTHRSIDDTGHMCLLERKCLLLPSQKGTCLSLLATG
jgi:hypothetical protein